MNVSTPLFIPTFASYYHDISGHATKQEFDLLNSMCIHHPRHFMIIAMDHTSYWINFRSSAGHHFVESVVLTTAHSKLRYLLIIKGCCLALSCKRHGKYHWNRLCRCPGVQQMRPKNYRKQRVIPTPLNVHGWTHHCLKIYFKFPVAEYTQGCSGTVTRSKIYL